MRYSACTDIGKVRQVNEDSYYIPMNVETDIPLFIVADGISGNNAGEVASKLAIDTITEYIKLNFEKCTKNRHEISRLLTESILHANKVVYEKSTEDEQYSNMGTTIVVVLIHEERLYIAHVGDSRLYVVKNHHIFQLTRDHTYVEHLVERGILTRQQAAEHPKRNLITRAIGTESIVEIDISVRRFLTNETFILCTDGLSNMVKDLEIRNTVNKFEAPSEIAEELINMANQAGGLDNITAIIIKKEIESNFLE